MSTKQKSSPEVVTHTEEEKPRKLILFNDEVNTFDHVIEALVEICGHDLMQAENCAMVAHYNGKCAVKNGSLSQLKPLARQMDLRDLTVEIT